MKSGLMKGITFFLIIFLAGNVVSLSGQSRFLDEQEECTIGVAAGSATADGRPLLWKTRDFITSPDNEIKYNTAYPNKFISVSNAGSSTSSWMGVNEHGFSIINSLLMDLHTNAFGPSNGPFMRDVLGYCKTVAEFQDYLDSTNISGRSTHANFGVIDSTGAAAIFETGGSVYYRFDATDSPTGYLIRTNFSVNGGGSAGIERYNRSAQLISNFFAGDSLSYKSIIRYQMRDFSDVNSSPLPVPYSGTFSTGIPYGYINCEKSICNSSSVSAAVIHGVLPTELAGLTTMWTILGQPAASVALPYWPVGNTPAEADGFSTSELCDKAHDLQNLLFDYAINTNCIDSHKLRDSIGAGFWPCIFPIEDYIFSETKKYMDSFRSLDSIPVSSMLYIEAGFAGYALENLQYCYQTLNMGIENVQANAFMDVYPNPATDFLMVNFDKSGNFETSKLSIYNVMGALVSTEILSQPLQHINVSELMAGIYMIEIKSNNITTFQKLIIQK